MIIHVKVFTKSKKKGFVEKDGIINAYLSSAPEKGHANAELVKKLSHKFNIPQSQIEIIKGTKSKNKTIKLDIKK